jgi:hypothetical protein
MNILSEPRLGRFASHLKRTVVGLGFNASRDELNAIFDRQFSEGKRAADFVGMIGQSAVSQFFSMYSFKHYYDRSLSFIEHQSFAMAGLIFLALYLFIAYKVLKIVMYYFIRDAANHTTLVGKIYPVAISILTAFLVYYAQFKIVQAIVQSNALLR